MKHYGDITKISGYEVPIVDVITSGSPCQDLSVAGKRAGLDGERSGLFMEQIRIIKEMRSRYVRVAGADQLVRRPRYCVWENVPGAFSSNGGKDFQTVLTEFARVSEPDAPDVPMPKKGRWPKAGCLYDDLGRWSVAWRVHDAQFWGVPQRRKRIALVADFGGSSAPEILFERKGLSGDSEPCGEAREETAGAVGGGAKSASYGFEPGAAKRLNTEGRFVEECAPTLRAEMGDNQVSVAVGGGVESASVSVDALSFAQNQVGEVRASPISGTLNTNSNATGRNSPLVYENHSQDSRYKPLGEVSETVNAKYGTGGNNQPLVVSDVLPFDTTQVTSDKNWSSPHYGDPCHPLAAQAHVPSIASPSIVRRLTPLECERLQGFPDGWTDIGEWTDTKGKKHKDADGPRYKALGNSIALPFWQYLARRICAQYEHNITMASLFDGIGGFPLVFESCGAKAVWASEIEEFPIAVTKRHFPEES